MIYLTRSHTESHRGTPRALPPQGKFYELYEADADVGNKELGLKISDRVNMKMAGVPEKTFVEYAGKLIGLGYVCHFVSVLKTAIMFCFFSFFLFSFRFWGVFSCFLR